MIMSCSVASKRFGCLEHCWEFNPTPELHRRWSVADCLFEWWEIGWVVPDIRMECRRSRNVAVAVAVVAVHTVMSLQVIANTPLWGYSPLAIRHFGTSLSHISPESQSIPKPTNSTIIIYKATLWRHICYSEVWLLVAGVVSLIPLLFMTTNLLSCILGWYLQTW